MDQGFVTEQQLAQIASNALASHVEPLKRHAALMRFDRTYDPEKEAVADQAVATVYDLLAIYGPEREPTFGADCPVRRQLIGMGASEATIASVAASYKPARASAAYDAGPGARQHLTEVGLPDDPANMAMVYDVLVRARAQALRQRAESRFAGSSSASRGVPAEPNDQTSLLTAAVQDLQSTVHEVQTAIVGPVRGRPDGRPVPIEALKKEIDAFVAMKLASGRWRAKRRGENGTQLATSVGRATTSQPKEPARNHARATLEVFADFLRMEEVEFVHEVDQSLIADFMQLLNQLPTHYRRSSALRNLPLVELIARTRNDTDCKRGLDPKTLRRHVGDLGQFWAYLKGQGRAVRPIDFVSVKPPKPRRLPSEDAQKWQHAQLERFLRTPIFTGCLAADRRGEPGPHVIRDGAFFVPLMALLMGLRREEAAGLETDAVSFVGRTPVVHVRENVVRDVKTLKSSRTIPIHRELVRLGLLRLASLRRKGREPLLFPELTSSPSVAMGDRVYDVLVDAAGPVSSDVGSALIPRPIHGLRHWCNSAMKDGGVASEIRDDILGKRGLKETEDRYARPARLEHMQAGLHASECMTGHIPLWRRAEID